MLTQSSGIHLTIDLKKHKTGYSLLSESHSISPLDYKSPVNWLILVVIKVNCYWKIFKRINTVREMTQRIDFLFLILVVLYLMCQCVAINSAVYWHTISEEHSGFAFSFKVVYSLAGRKSAILKGVNNLFYTFLDQ